MHGDVGAVTRQCVAIVDDQVQGANIHLMPPREFGQRRIGQGGEARLVDELLPREQHCPGAAVDAAAQLLGDRERRQAGPAQLDQKLLFIITVRLRECREVLIVHCDLDAACLALLAHAHGRNVGSGQERNG